MNGDLFLSVFAPAVIPLSVGILMNLLEGLIEDFTWQRRLIRVGWDSAVLSVGLTAGVFSDTKVIAFYRPQGIATAEIGCLLAELFCVMMMAYIRRHNPDQGWKALACMTLGGLSLMLPVWMHAIALGFHLGQLGI